MRFKIGQKVVKRRQPIYDTYDNFVGMDIGTICVVTGFEPASYNRDEGCDIELTGDDGEEFDSCSDCWEPLDDSRELTTWAQCAWKPNTVRV